MLKSVITILGISLVGAIIFLAIFPNDIERMLNIRSVTIFLGVIAFFITATVATSIWFRLADIPADQMTKFQWLFVFSLGTNLCITFSLGAGFEIDGENLKFSLGNMGSIEVVAIYCITIWSTMKFNERYIEVKES